MRGLPWATALLGLGCAAATWVPGAAEWLVWDREALARGEAWRLVTGIGVHFSASHLAWNLGALGLLGAVLEPRDRRAYTLTLALATVVTGPLLLVLEGGMARFGGASGLAAAAFALLCLRGLRRGGPSGGLALLGLSLLVAKIWVEAGGGTTSLSRLPGAESQPTAWAHGIGLATAALVHLSARPRRAGGPPGPSPAARAS